MSYCHLSYSESPVCSYHSYTSIHLSTDHTHSKTEGDILSDNIFDSHSEIDECSRFHHDFDDIDLNDHTSCEDVNGDFSEDKSIDFHSGTSLDTSPSVQSIHQHANQVSSLYYGLQPTHYLSRPQNKSIYSVTYSDRAHKFILLDESGILSWCPENNHLDRQYLYPPYKHKLFLEIHFSSKYNVYFVLTEQRAIVTFNSLFEKLHVTTCLENSLLNIYFLDMRNLLIGGGVNGVSIWKYTKHDIKKQPGYRIRSQRPMENYFLYSTGITSIPDNKLIRRIKICFERKWIFALSFYDVFVLTFDGILCKSFLNLHKQTIRDCLFNTRHSLLLTVSNDSTLTLWSECGFPLHTFNSTSKSNNAVLQHPLSPHLVLVATDKGFIKCYNLLTLEEEFSHQLMDSFIETIDSIYITKQYMLYAISAQNISVFDFNYFCEFWGHLSNSILYICFDTCKHKSNRFHALCVDGSIRIYSISENRTVSLVLPPPNIQFPSSLDSVTYDRSSNLLYILIGPQEIWVYTTRTQPSCLLETYQQDILLSILNPEDPDSGNFVQTGITPHSFFPFCTCIATVNSDIILRSLSVQRNETHSNLLVLGVKDGRLVFISTTREFDKLFEMQVSTGEVTHVRVYENYSQLITQSVSVNGFVLKLWSLPTLEQIYCFELRDTLVAYWKINDTLMIGFSGGSLSLYSIKGIGSSLGGASIETSLETGGDSSLDRIINIHGLERLNLFCTAHNSGIVKIWDHHKNLVKLIVLNRSLGGVYFLNNSGDLLISLNQHLYIIRHEHVLSSVSFIQGTDNKKERLAVLEESAVFENPNSQNGELVSTTHGLYYIDTLQSYLKPYDIDLHGPKGLSILDEMLYKDLRQPVSSSSSHISEYYLTPIPSEILLTPTQSPLLLSYENFPNPVFSTPTASRTSTPPPTKLSRIEAMRKEIVLKENQITNITVEGSTPSLFDEQIQQLRAVSDKTVYDKDRKVVSKIDSIMLTSRTNLSKTNPRIYINPQHSQTIHKTQETADLLEKENENIIETSPKPSIATSRVIPRNTHKSRTLRRRHGTRQETIIQRISVPPSVPDERTIVNVLSTPQNTPPSARAAGEFPNMTINQVRNITLPKKREFISRMKTKEELVKTEDIHSPTSLQSMQATSQIEVKIDKEKLCKLSSMQDKETNIQIKQRKIFPLNTITNHDFSFGWHEREYLKRLAYRVKQGEKRLHLLDYQAKLYIDASLLRAKLYPEFYKEKTKYLDLDQMLEFVEQKEGILNRSRNSTITLNQSATFSASSFYVHKLHNASQLNFRISNTSQSSIGMKPTFSVRRKSRCVSAPFLRRDLTKLL